MVVGFIGFGEAASSIALGLHKEGIERIVCCDAMQNDERFKDFYPAICKKAHITKYLWRYILQRCKARTSYI